MIVSVEKASMLIKDGHIVAIPTETVYGLAADAFNILAVKKTFEIKGRPPDNPLIVHISNIEQLNRLSDEIPAIAYKLADVFWPGPLTLVIKKKPAVPDIVTGGLHSVAVRMPDHQQALELIEKTGPLTAPSANKSGRPSATRPGHIENDFGNAMPILEGASPGLGIESTVLDIRSDRLSILRPGFITAKMIREQTKLNVDISDSKSLHDSASPGTRYTHYKPAADVKIIPEMPVQPEPDCYYIFHSLSEFPDRPNIHNYRGDFEKFGRDLYDHFRQADHQNYSQILIEELPHEDVHPLIPALNDRIGRASSK